MSPGVASGLPCIHPASCGHHCGKCTYGIVVHVLIRIGYTENGLAADRVDPASCVLIFVHEKDKRLLAARCGAPSAILWAVSAAHQLILQSRFEFQDL